jgi:2-hydroxyethylphosphonate dioxygenase
MGSKLKINKEKLLYFMNVRKLTPKHMQNVYSGDIEKLLKMDTFLEEESIEKIAKKLNINKNALIKKSQQSEELIFLTKEELEKTKRAVFRDGIHFYNYYTLPTPIGYISPVILDILCPSDKVPKLNNGHFEEAITVNLGPDDIYGRWDEDIKIEENFSIINANNKEDDWILGDSYFEPSYCKHSYSLVNSNTSAKIISYTAYNELSTLKDAAKNLPISSRNSIFVNRKYSLQFQIIEKFRKSSYMSEEILCKLANIKLNDYEKLKYNSLDESSINAISSVLKIDPRLLKAGSSGGDSLGKEYMSIEESRNQKSDYLGYTVAPTARSPRSPDLKGTFIKVKGNLGGDLELQHNVHYLVTQGNLFLTYWDGEILEQKEIELKPFDSLWLPPGLKHLFKGQGSLLALTNGETFGYLSDFALANIWNKNEVTDRFIQEEIGWGYD